MGGEIDLPIEFAFSFRFELARSLVLTRSLGGVAVALPLPLSVTAGISGAAASTGVSAGLDVVAFLTGRPLNN